MLEAMTDDVRGECPGWWPFAMEFPGWEVWRGVDRLYYARLAGAADPPVTDPPVGTSPVGAPPVTVRGEDAVDLRDQIRAVILRSPS
jgi:hypothetical protein